MIETFLGQIPIKTFNPKMLPGKTLKFYESNGCIYGIEHETGEIYVFGVKSEFQKVKCLNCGLETENETNSYLKIGDAVTCGNCGYKGRIFKAIDGRLGIGS